jgi:hypothetical protein
MISARGFIGKLPAGVASMQTGVPNNPGESQSITTAAVVILSVLAKNLALDAKTRSFGSTLRMTACGFFEAPGKMGTPMQTKPPPLPSAGPPGIGLPQKCPS